MRILMLAEPYLVPDASRAQQVHTLLSVLSDAYNEYADDDEAYLATDYVDTDTIVLGTDNPQAILDAAAGWNANIWNNLRSAINSYIASFDKALFAKDVRSGLNNAATYELKKAAMAADDDFYSFADDALYIPTVTSNALYFRTVLSQEDYLRIQAKPEDYAILDIDAK